MIQEVLNTLSNIILFLEGALCVLERALVGLLVLETRFLFLEAPMKCYLDCCLAIQYV